MTDASPNRLLPAAGLTASRRKGDTPSGLLTRYLVEHDLRGRPARYFRDHRQAEPSFTDRGGSLVATSAYPDAVRDMVAIARHRGWTRLRVSGDERFRQAAWIEARSQGLEVYGYRPRSRDRQAAGDPIAPPLKETLVKRLKLISAVIEARLPEAKDRDRLIAHAWRRAGLTREPERSRYRPRDR